MCAGAADETKVSRHQAPARSLVPVPLINQEGHYVQVFWERPVLVPSRPSPQFAESRFSSRLLSLGLAAMRLLPLELLCVHYTTSAAVRTA